MVGGGWGGDIASNFSFNQKIKINLIYKEEKSVGIVL